MITVHNTQCHVYIGAQMGAFLVIALIYCDSIQCRSSNLHLGLCCADLTRKGSGYSKERPRQQ